MSDFPALAYPWQRSLWQGFLDQWHEGRLPHALMLAGPAGVGKGHLAEAMAQYVLCHNPVSDAACGQCKSCGLNRAGTHPDFARVEPEAPGKAIRVDDVRALTQTQNKTAQLSGYKVVILKPAESMNTNAANALLKTLEEPAARTLLILVSHSPDSVLPTIRSRCQMRSVSLPREEQTLPWLEPLVSGTDYSARELLAEVRGAPLAARDLLRGDALEQRRGWLEALRQISLGETDCLSVAAQWQRGDAQPLLDWLAGWVHDLARWQVGATSARLESLDGSFTRVLSGINPAYLHRYQEKLLAARQRLASGANPNKQLLMEELLLDWEVLITRQAKRSS